MNQVQTFVVFKCHLCGKLFTDKAVMQEHYDKELSARYEQRQSNKLITKQRKAKAAQILAVHLRMLRWAFSRARSFEALSTILSRTNLAPLSTLLVDTDNAQTIAHDKYMEEVHNNGCTAVLFGNQEPLPWRNVERHPLRTLNFHISTKHPNAEDVAAVNRMSIDYIFTTEVAVNQRDWDLIDCNKMLAAFGLDFFEVSLSSYGEKIRLITNSNKLRIAFESKSIRRCSLSKPVLASIASSLATCKEEALNKVLAALANKKAQVRVAIAKQHVAQQQSILKMEAARFERHIQRFESSVNSLRYIREIEQKSYLIGMKTFTENREQSIVQLFNLQIEGLKKSFDNKKTFAELLTSHAFLEDIGLAPYVVADQLRDSASIARYYDNPAHWNQAIKATLYDYFHNKLSMQEKIAGAVADHFVGDITQIMSDSISQLRLNWFYAHERVMLNTSTPTPEVMHTLHGIIVRWWALRHMFQLLDSNEV